MNAADQPKKTPRWSDIANAPAFKNADKATRQEVRGKFFDRVVRPNTPDGMLEEVQSKFFTQTESDVFGEKPESVIDGDTASDDGPNMASNALRNAGERGLDLAGNALQFVGNMAEKGEQLIAEHLGGLNPGSSAVKCPRCVRRATSLIWRSVAMDSTLLLGPNRKTPRPG